ncbi:oxidoreductase [Chromatiaceae bacterium AAb-1]|nr:oxidoreductase [Chromatiaceae bacterium AAb-1]
MRTWLITGASRGFGTLITEKILNAGEQVIATARKPETLTERFGQHPNLLAVKLDVNSAEDAAHAAAAGFKRFGRIDILVNNAGYGLLGAVEEASETETENLFRTNVFGVLNVTNAVLPLMRQQNSGHIINISSIGAVQAYVGWGVYGATKFAVEGITEALAQELAPLGIYATVVQPGFFRTDFLDEQSLVRSNRQIADYHQTAGAMRNFADDYNHAQPGDPVKFAEAIYQLAQAEKPPVRLPLGSDTVARVHEKTGQVLAELEQWLPLSLSTDLTAV